MLHNPVKNSWAVDWPGSWLRLFGCHFRISLHHLDHWVVKRLAQDQIDLFGALLFRRLWQRFLQVFVESPRRCSLSVKRGQFNLRMRLHHLARLNPLILWIHRVWIPLFEPSRGKWSSYLGSWVSAHGWLHLCQPLHHFKVWSSDSEHFSLALA